MKQIFHVYQVCTRDHSFRKVSPECGYTSERDGCAYAQARAGSWSDRNIYLVISNGEILYRYCGRGVPCDPDSAGAQRAADSEPAEEYFDPRFEEAA